MCLKGVFYKTVPLCDKYDLGFLLSEHSDQPGHLSSLNSHALLSMGS